MRNFAIVIAICLCSSILASLLCSIGSSVDIYPCDEFYTVQYVAHGRYGIDSLADNSMELFDKLVRDLKYRIVEADIQFTKDSVPVLCHETNISIIAKNKKGEPIDANVKDLLLPELKTYRFSKPYKIDNQICSTDMGGVILRIFVL